LPDLRNAQAVVKLFFLCQRRDGLSHEAYAERLLHGHVPLALRHHPALRRYTVNVVNSSSPGSPPLDSIGELGFASLDDYRERLYDSDDGARIIAQDVRGFLGAAHAYATTEHVQRPPTRAAQLGERSAGVKFVAAVRRADGLSHDEFVHGWLERHVPLVLADTRLRGYKTNVVNDRLSADAPQYDGIAELYFDSDEDLDRHIQMSRDSAKPIRADIQRFVAQAVTYRVAEYVQR
jgi:uncharacterized protein (TIGR02118 family)